MTELAWFAFGSYSLVILVVVTLMASWWGVTNDEIWPVGISILLYIIIFWQNISENRPPWSHVVLGVTTYIILGAGWTTFKWSEKNRLYRSRYDEAKIAFLKDHEIENPAKSTPIPLSLKDTWKKFCDGERPYSTSINLWQWSANSFYGLATVSKPPEITKHLQALSTWFTCWPLSIANWLLIDAITWVSHRVIDSLKGILENINNYWYHDTEVDFKSEEE